MTGEPRGVEPESVVAAEGLRRALDLLDACSTESGFVASPVEQANYHRVWGRDGGICVLAALLSGDSSLVETARATLTTLARHRGPHGEIPSNVTPDGDDVSLGGTAGRVDADLWFAIACGQYWRRTGDRAFLHDVAEAIEGVRFLLGAWEFNARGLIYVPATGDWADEFLHSGYVLYDQLLHLQALREFDHLHTRLHGAPDPRIGQQIDRLLRLLRANYWIERDCEETPDDAYHPDLYDKARRVAEERRAGYWMPFFSPVGYGYRFDAFANVLASLLGVADTDQIDSVDHYVDDLEDGSFVLPAFHPVITPRDEDWEELQMTFSHSFKNQPHEFQNGGRWPVITGFYVADLAARGEHERARRYLDGIHRANASELDGHAWSFPEFLHGREHTPGGASPLAWSAAAAVIGHHALDGERVFLGTDDQAAPSAIRANRS